MGDDCLTRIDVTLGDRTYPILIEAGSFDQIGERLRERFQPDAPVVVLSDENVARIYLDNIEGILHEAGFETWPHIIRPGEASKRLETAAEIYDFLIERKTPRGGIILGLGGGVVGDIAAFIASTYMRGVPYVAVPTTLLAQVDSSVGGKTGLHHGGEKNVVGTFYQPRFVLIDTDCLSTLPRRELLAGMAEVVKQGAIKDAGFFTFLESEYRAVLHLKRESLIKVVSDCCRLKVHQTVDPYPLPFQLFSNLTFGIDGTHIYVVFCTPEMRGPLFDHCRGTAVGETIDDVEYTHRHS